MSQGRHHAEDEAKPFLDEDRRGSSPKLTAYKKGGRSMIIMPWIVAAVSWLVTIYLLFAQRGVDSWLEMLKANATSPISNGQCNTYYPTDFEAIRPSISYETRTFTGALYYDMATKRFIRNATTEGPEYVGPPSKAIDDAWEDLLAKEWAPMTEEESLTYRPRLKTFNEFYRFEPDVLHSLHCVNQIRKRIDIDYYSQPEHVEYTIDQEDWDRIHIDHCIDQIRQTIMCFGDVSPVPLYSWEGAPLGIGQGTAHTCRKWDPIRQWVIQRRLDMNDTFV